MITNALNGILLDAYNLQIIIPEESKKLTNDLEKN